MRRLILSFVPFLLLPSLVHGAPRISAPANAKSFDAQRRLDVNNLNLYVSNFGNIGYDPSTGGPGLYYPRGTSKSVLYSSGLWFAAGVNGQLRLALADYSSEYGPGAIVGGTYENPGAPGLAVWKVLPWSGNLADTAHVDRTPAELAADPTMDPVAHHGWSEYMTNAVPRGAPVRTWALPGPGGVGTVNVAGPDVTGDQMLWCVFNDANPANHTDIAGGSAPIGIEVQQTVFGFNRPGALGQTAFVRWRIVNKSGQPLSATRAGFWLDPDLGSFIDDLVGCDVGRSLGYAYNATNADLVYGSTPPALGADLLGPGGAGAFTHYINGADPVGAAQTFNVLSGLNADGTSMIDPTTGNPSLFYATGDPVAGTGWLDSNPSDRRMLISRGLGNFAPGQAMDVWAALVVGQGADRLASVAQLQCWDDYAEQVYSLGFPASLPVGGSCSVPLNCPRPPGFYVEECGGAGHLSSAQLQQLGTIVGAQTVSLSPALQPGGFCATVADASDVRALAKAELAALIANCSAAPNAITPVGVPPIRLDAGLSASVPGVTGATIGDLIARAAPLGLSAFYSPAMAGGPVPFAGVNWGLSQFGGGADFACNFLGSSLDPVASPDSFHTVQVVFDPAHPGKAYRYLRLEVGATGAVPPQGRGYVYAGYVNVPFVARDSVTGAALEVGFAERAFTDQSGTLLPSAAQPATFDSTWAPSDDAILGGREYLMIHAHPSSGTPRAELASDGALANGALPWLYFLGARRVTPTAWPAAGDTFVFSRRRPSGPGVDLRLLDLAAMPLSDPAVTNAYTQIANALGQINSGYGIPNSCGGSTAALASLVSATSQPGRAEIEWDVAGALVVQVQRFAAADGWQALGTAAVSGSGRVQWQDAGVTPGARYGYRLALGAGGSAPFAGETWLDIPLTAQLAIAGFTPNPGVGPIAVRFSLPAAGRAQVRVLDIAGRSVFARDVSTLGPGTHTVPLGTALAPGIYWLRLTQGGASVSTKGILLR